MLLGIYSKEVIKKNENVVKHQVCLQMKKLKKTESLLIENLLSRL